MAICLCAVQGAALFGHAPAPRRAERRMALVIGNDKYVQMPALVNAVNDAQSVSRVLEELGFDVTLVTDGNLAAVTNAADQFLSSLRAGDVAVVFYAGHGIQIDGQNYLVPVDFTAGDENKARWAAYQADQVADRMARSGAALSVLILDACRNNPFAATRSGSRGLALMQGGRGSLIAFATAPGSVASDASTAGSNGLFTTHLVRALRRPGLTIEEVFAVVREDVYRESGGRQHPAVISSVLGAFYFLPGDGTSNAARSVSAEDELWAAIADSSSAELFAAYLKKYPAGRYVASASERVRSLRSAAGPATSPVQYAPGLTFPRAADGQEDELIRGVLKEYVEAFAARDAGRVRRIWPTADRVGLDALFASARSISVALSCGAVRVDGPSATVDCLSRTLTQPRRGEARESVPSTQAFDFRKHPTGWRIERLR